MLKLLCPSLGRSTQIAFLFFLAADVRSVAAIDIAVARAHSARVERSGHLSARVEGRAAHQPPRARAHGPIWAVNSKPDPPHSSREAAGWGHLDGGARLQAHDV